MPGLEAVPQAADAPLIFAVVLHHLGSAVDPVKAWPQVRNAVVANRATFGCGEVPEDQARDLAPHFFEALCNVMAIYEQRPEADRQRAAMGWLSEVLYFAAFEPGPTVN